MDMGMGMSMSMGMGMAGLQPASGLSLWGVSPALRPANGFSLLGAAGWAESKQTRTVAKV